MDMRCNAGRTGPSASAPRSAGSAAPRRIGRSRLCRAPQSVNRFRSSDERISVSRGFARATTTREKAAKMRQPTSDSDARRLASAKSLDLIWQMPSKLIALQITPASSTGSAGRYIELLRLNRRSRLRMAFASGSLRLISLTRSRDATSRLVGTRSQEELRSTYFGKPLMRSPRKYADSVATTSP